MIEWRYMTAGWTEVFTERESRCMIVRHPNQANGRYVVWIDGKLLSSHKELAFAKWKAQNILEGENV